MSLLNKASLIQIPSGYKDGTLYSAKPTNGDGDFTFSRGSNLAATRVNSDGLIEKGRENLLLQSNQFDTTWSQSNVSVTSGQTGYDGSNDAWLLSISGGTSDQRIFQNIQYNGVSTLSVYAKKNDSNWLSLRIGSSVNKWYDLENGVLGGSTIVTAYIDASIEDVGNGWYRCSLTFTDNFTTSTRIYPAENDLDITHTSGSIYIQDAQTEVGLVATDYIETGASTAQAGILEDMPRLDYSGGATCGSLLLEPQRSNILSHSEYLPIGMSFARSTFTNNDAISPEGLKNATKWQMTSDTGAHYLRKGFTTSDTYSVSVFAKKGNYRYLGLRSGSTLIGFDFDTETFVGGTGTKEAFGDGWWRLSVTATGSGFSYFGIHYSNSSGGEQTTADGTEYYHIYGMQIELGSYPTSYIPTYGSGVTRSADDCTDAGNSSLFNDSEGVLFVEIAKLDISATEGGVRLSKDTNNEIRLNFATSNRLNLFVNVGGSNQVYMDNSSYDLEDYHKIAIKYKLNDYAVYVDGTKIHTDTSATVPTGLDELYFNTFYGKVKSVKVFNTALTDAECIDLTTI